MEHGTICLERTESKIWPRWELERAAFFKFFWGEIPPNFDLRRIFRSPNVEASKAMNYDMVLEGRNNDRTRKLITHACFNIPGKIIISDLELAFHLRPRTYRKKKKNEYEQTKSTESWLVDVERRSEKMVGLEITRCRTLLLIQFR